MVIKTKMSKLRRSLNPPKPGPQSRALYGTVFTINSCSTLLNWPIVSLLILFILFSNVFQFFLHDYTLCFTGSHCCNVSYYNYISIWPYSIVIPLQYLTLTLNGVLNYLHSNIFSTDVLLCSITNKNILHVWQLDNWSKLNFWEIFQHDITFLQQ